MAFACARGVIFLKGGQCVFVESALFERLERIASGASTQSLKRLQTESGDDTSNSCSLIVINGWAVSHPFGLELR